MAGEITFRPLAWEDLPLLSRWRSQPHVRRWFEPLTQAQMEAKYGPRIAGADPTRSFLSLLDDRPFGYIQWYRLHDYPEYAAALGVGRGSAGVDLFIGEPDLVGQGLGARMLQAFLRQHVFPHADIECCILGPAASNTAAIRCYEKAGFRFWKNAHVPGEEEPEHLMLLTRSDFSHPEPGAVEDLLRNRARES